MSKSQRYGSVWVLVTDEEQVIYGPVVHPPDQPSKVNPVKGVGVTVGVVVNIGVGVFSKVAVGVSVSPTCSKPMADTFSPDCDGKTILLMNTTSNNPANITPMIF
jgi:hypothetical protein